MVGREGAVPALWPNTVSALPSGMIMLALLWKEERGQDLTEYAFFLLLIFLAGVAAMNSLAAAVSKTFSNATSDLTSS